MGTPRKLTSKKQFKTPIPKIRRGRVVFVWAEGLSAHCIAELETVVREAEHSKKGYYVVSNFPINVFVQDMREGDTVKVEKP